MHVEAKTRMFNVIFKTYNGFTSTKEQLSVTVSHSKAKTTSQKPFIV